MCELLAKSKADRKEIISHIKMAKANEAAISTKVEKVKQYYVKTHKTLD